MTVFADERQMLRQIIGEMEAALADTAQPVLAPGALEGWQTTFNEVTGRIEASPQDPVAGGVQHLHARAHELLTALMRDQ